MIRTYKKITEQILLSLLLLLLHASFHFPKSLWINLKSALTSTCLAGNGILRSPAKKRSPNGWVHQSHGPMRFQILVGTNIQLRLTCFIMIYQGTKQLPNDLKHPMNGFLFSKSSTNGHQNRLSQGCNLALPRHPIYEVEPKNIQTRHIQQFFWPQPLIFQRVSRLRSLPFPTLWTLAPHWRKRRENTACHEKW